MKIAITGASGFLGKLLVEQLLREGHSLNLLGRNKPAALPPGATFFKWEAIREEPPAESLNGTDAVIHLAGEPVGTRWNDEIKRKILESRSIGTRHLVQALSTVSARPRVLVSASATGLYGDRGEDRLTETSRPGKGFLADVCIEWEKQAALAESLGMRVALIRTGIVLGNEGGALPRMLTPFKVGAGATLGSGRQWMPWIHVDDLLAQYSFALHQGEARGAMNGTAPNPVRNSEFTETLAEVLHRPALLFAPKFALKLMLGEMAEVVLSSQKVIPEVPRALGFQFRFPDLKPALQALLK